MEQTTIPESLVTAEFNRSTEKAHVIACWVGIVLNIVWFLGDYLSIPEFWIPFLIFIDLNRNFCTPRVTFL